ncbi:histidine kinase dimerization/phosphoacceptor domain -containing protein [Chitinophaga sp. CF418]|uniref:tetratricopeptide repeat-containing sensor histidine kinase n=1 Tax=Chitinophaga sp. CF418 TaxID=1855287 RepID=UPI00091B04D2|nr:histidine kinase dimerization/phosphoacceptor domain -containing protein [Chitinophaga sp. CF418]SHN45796.1 Two-component sensor histidine kinase, contains HisKA and HATPase domains [Chitinophaga sp. CF418]
MYRLPLVFHIMLLGILPCMGQPETSVPALQRQLLKSTTDTQRINILLQLGNVYVNRVGENTADLDSGLLYIGQAARINAHVKDPHWEARCFYSYSKAYREKKMLAEGEAAILKARAILQTADQPEDLGDVLMENGNYYTIDAEPQLEEKIRLYEEARVQYHKAGDKRKEAYAIRMTGDCYHCWGKFREAVEMLNKALALYKETGRKDVQGLYDLLGIIATGTGDYSLGMTYGLMALKTAEEQHDSSLQLCTIYNRLGITYFQLGDYKQALESLRKALKIANRYKDTASILVVSTNIVGAYLKIGQPEAAIALLNNIVGIYRQPIFKDRIWISANLVKCYTEMHQYDRAKVFIPWLLSHSREMSAYNYYQTMIYDALIKYYLATRQYVDASYYCSLQDDVCKKIGLVNVLSDNYLRWFQADSALKNYPAAIKHYQEYKIMNDSLFQVAKAGQIARLQVQFDIDKKDKNIRLQQQNIELLTRQGLLQQSALKQARLTRNVIILGATLLLLLLLAGFSRYLTKQKNNKQLQQKQDEIYKQNLSLQQLINTQDKLLEEKEWLVKEIHHRVKNNLQIVMSLLNTQAAYLHDADALEAIKESKHRMQAISLIHQKLYQSENMALIDMPTYTRELIGYLKDSIEGVQRIYFDLQIAPVQLDVSLAVPVGLILNEALTNAVKYAFWKNEKGIVTVSLQCTLDSQLILSVSDNGHGFPPGFDVFTQGSMGTRLMETLAEQLEGTISIREEQGVSVIVSFKQQIG